MGTFFYWIPWGLAVHAGPAVYLLPPRPGRLSPFVAARGGLGVGFGICFDCDGWALVPGWLASATAGLEYVTRAALAPGRHLRVVLDGGALWVGDFEGRRSRPISFGRLGVGGAF